MEEVTDRRDNRISVDTSLNSSQRFNSAVPKTLHSEDQKSKDVFSPQEALMRSDHEPYFGIAV